MAQARPLLQRIVDWWIPTTLSVDPDQRWKTRFLVQMLLLGMAISTLMAAFYVFTGVWLLVAQCAAVSLALLIAATLLRWKATFRLSSHLSIGSVTVAFVVPPLLERQLDGAGLAWFCIPPFVAVLVLGPRAAWGWVIVSVASAVGLYLHPLSWGTIDLAPHVVVVRAVMLTVTILVFALSFESRQREVRAELERASRAKSSFLANMSHELRTPMNGVLGLTEVVLQDPALPASHREQLELVRSSGRAMVALVNGILDLSKVEAGKLSIERTAFSPGALLEELSGLYAPAAAQKGLEWRVVPEGPLPPAVLGDPLRLRQVLCNLVDNALKFTSRGSVRLTVSRSADEQTRFAVTDTGAGIAPEVAARLFTPFEQADNSTTRRFGGTGLGLALSRQLVELMGGALTLQSTPEQGSTFTFTLHLPPSAAPVEGPRLITPTPSAPRKRRVLVVDDNPINLRVACALVTTAGYDADAAHDGREALARLDTAAYDAVLMDCHMPVMDGFEATRAIRGLPDDKAQTPIVALTAAALPEELAACRAAGMNECLTKPVGLAALAATLERIIPPPRQERDGEKRAGVAATGPDRAVT